MNDDELIERLRRTFRDRANGVQPAPGRLPSGEPAPDWSFRPMNDGLGAAAAAGSGLVQAGGAADAGAAGDAGGAEGRGERRTAEYPTFKDPGPVAIAGRRRRGWPPAVGAGAIVAAAAAAAITVAVSGGKHPVTVQPVGHGSPVRPPYTPVPSSVAPEVTAPTATSPSPAYGGIPDAPAVPPGFQPESVTFVSADDGWVLGSAPGSGCPALVRTTDGGRTWSRSGAPWAATSCDGAASTIPSRFEVRFADLSDGWVYPATGTSDLKSKLWSTHDGGATWKEEVPVPGGSIGALEVSGGQVQMVVFGPCPAGSSGCQGQTVEEISSSPVAADQWKTSPSSPSIGAGPVLSPALTLWGTSGWLINNNRTVVSGARLTPDTGWLSWKPACSGAGGPGLVAASSSTQLVAICAEGQWGPPDAGTNAGQNWLFRSEDGGTSFAVVGAVPGDQPQSVATTPGTPETVVLADGTGNLGVTFDGGSTWAVTHPGQGGGAFRFGYVGFTTATQGVALSTGAIPGATAALFMTRDGGHTWSQVRF